MKATSEHAPYEPDVPIRNRQGTWVAIAAGAVEAVRVFIPGRSGNEPDPNFSLWWDGSASPRAVRDWVAERMGTIPLEGDLPVECRIKILADHAPKEMSYRIDNVGRIADDIKKCSNDAAIACSIEQAPRNIEQAPRNRKFVYMWAELKASDAQTRHGEVGLQYAGNLLETAEGKLVFSTLLRDTAVRNMSNDEVEEVYEKLKDNVRKYANAPRQEVRHA